MAAIARIASPIDKTGSHQPITRPGGVGCVHSHCLCQAREIHLLFRHQDHQRPHLRQRNGSIHHRYGLGSNTYQQSRCGQHLINLQGQQIAGRICPRRHLSIFPQGQSGTGSPDNEAVSITSNRCVCARNLGTIEVTRPLRANPFGATCSGFPWPAGRRAARRCFIGEGPGGAHRRGRHPEMTNR